ncbi:MlaD family protein [Mycobacterium sp. pUA109]|uniref:MlaD family protein n=1 Tax=Mycobacterium sp. pUA109 TaxID=3238982 RepID=UPI00351ACC33
MPNSFDTDPRGPSNRLLIFAGICFIVIMTITNVAAVAKSKGTLDNLVRVDAQLVNIGDGLPARSDVKFRGVLVGSVAQVAPSTHGGPNVVHIDLQPDYASGIPNTVTARVVPTNLFAVSTVQLIDNGPGSGPLRPGAVVHEDKTRSTLVFQDALAKLRRVLASVGHGPGDHSVGLIAALGEATHGRGQQLTDAGHDFNEILAQLNTVVSPDDVGPSTLSALSSAADELRVASPDLFNALDNAIRPMRTFAEKRQELTDFLSGGLHTTETLGEAFEHQIDRLISISTEFTPALGVLADHADDFPNISTRVQALANNIYDEAYDPDTHLFTAKAVIAFTPTRSYVRADCPRYGALEGPSCQTAPEVPTAPDLMPALASRGFPPTPGVTENRPNVTPPRHSMPEDPQGPPAPPAPPWVLPPLPPGSKDLPEGYPPAPSPEPTAEPSAFTPGGQPQAVIIGGNVGPVGSREEKAQLSRIVGGHADTATEFLLGPLARGSTVYVAPDPGDGP